MKLQHESHDAFLLRMMASDKLSPQLLVNISAETSRRLLDNADNEMGAPALGRGTAVVLKGQLHEYAGAIPDVKARIANHLEQKEEEAKRAEIKKDALTHNTPTPKPGNR